MVFGFAQREMGKKSIQVYSKPGKMDEKPTHEDNGYGFVNSSHVLFLHLNVIYHPAMDVHKCLSTFLMPFYCLYLIEYHLCTLKLGL